MCFNLKYKIKLGKKVCVKETKNGEEDESKGLLYAEIERWKKQQEEEILKQEKGSNSNRSSSSKNQ